MVLFVLREYAVLELSGFNVRYYPLFKSA